MHENLFELVDRPLRSPSKLIGAIDVKTFSTTRLELWNHRITGHKASFTSLWKIRREKGTWSTHYECQVRTDARR